MTAYKGRALSGQRPVEEGPDLTTPAEQITEHILGEEHVEQERDERAKAIADRLSARIRESMAADEKRKRGRR